MGHLHPPNLNDYVLDRIYNWLSIHKPLKLRDLFGQACPAALPNQISGYATAKEKLNDIIFLGGWFIDINRLSTKLSCQAKVSRLLSVTHSIKTQIQN